MSRQIETKTSKYIFIVTAIHEDWGGSEEQWFATVPVFQQLGYTIVVCKEKINWNHSKFKWMHNNGVLLFDLDNFHDIFPKIIEKGIIEYKYLKLSMLLQVYRPTMVIINQGINFDGLLYGYFCKQKNARYVTVSHKAVDFYWPMEVNKIAMINAFKDAVHNYFVSNHNLNLTNEQFGMTIPNASIITYPIQLLPEPVPYPKVGEYFELALIGRLFLLDKGQDILFRIMAQPKWRSRNIRVTIFGKGDDKAALEGMRNFLKLNNIVFKGHIDFATYNLWEHHHALIMPSRSEGLPLVIQDAMAAGRTVITTNAGGTAEIIEDGKNGFVGEASFYSFDNTMERAWEAREQWGEMGKYAFKYFNNIYDHNNITNFCNEVHQLAHE